MKTVGDVARIFGVKQNIVKVWSYKFKDYLDPSANPPKGAIRFFSQKDIMVFTLIDRYWEEEPDYENIFAMRNRCEQFEEYYVRIALSIHLIFKNLPIRPVSYHETQLYGSGTVLTGDEIQCHASLRSASHCEDSEMLHFVQHDNDLAVVSVHCEPLPMNTT